MKMTKRIMAVILAVFLLAALAVVPASAAYQSTGGSISIANSSTGINYKAYRILDMEVNATTGAYIWKTNADWATFIEGQSSYFDVKNGIVTQKAAFSGTAPGAVALLAKDAITGTMSVAGDVDGNNGEAKITGLDCGYYLIVSSDDNVVALVPLMPGNDDAPNASATTKVTYPTIEKLVNGVKEDTVSAAEVLTYTITVAAGIGTDTYIITDVLPAGVSYTADSLSIAGATKDTDYTVSVSGQTVTVTLMADYRASLTLAQEIVVTYNATLNNTIATNGAANTNTATLTYDGDSDGISDETLTATASVKTYKFTVNKTGAGAPLVGATFELVDNSDTNVAVKATGTDGEYIVCNPSDIGAVTSIQMTDFTTFVIIGLDEGTYTLKETDAPDGYIAAEDEEYTFAPDHEITVDNKTGTILPTTGGVGTTIFYVAGLVLVLAAVTVLITKKRANA